MAAGGRGTRMGDGVGGSEKTSGDDSSSAPPSATPSLPDGEGDGEGEEGKSLLMRCAACRLSLDDTRTPSKLSSCGSHLMTDAR